MYSCRVYTRPLQASDTRSPLIGRPRSSRWRTYSTNIHPLPILISSAVSTSIPLNVAVETQAGCIRFLCKTRVVLKVGYRCFQDEEVEKERRGEETETVFASSTASFAENGFSEYLLFLSLVHSPVSYKYIPVPRYTVVLWNGSIQLELLVST